jgi:hypothetical protein
MPPPAFLAEIIGKVLQTPDREKPMAAGEASACPQVEDS